MDKKDITWFTSAPLYPVPTMVPQVKHHLGIHASCFIITKRIQVRKLWPKSFMLIKIECTWYYCTTIRKGIIAAMWARIIAFQVTHHGTAVVAQEMKQNKSWDFILSSWAITSRYILKKSLHKIKLHLHYMQPMRGRHLTPFYEFFFFHDALINFHHHACHGLVVSLSANQSHQKGLQVPVMGRHTHTHNAKHLGEMRSKSL